MDGRRGARLATLGPCPRCSRSRPTGSWPRRPSAAPSPSVGQPGRLVPEGGGHRPGARGGAWSGAGSPAARRIGKLLLLDVDSGPDGGHPVRDDRHAWSSTTGPAVGPDALRPDAPRPGLGPVDGALRGRGRPRGPRPPAAGRGRCSTPTCPASDPTPPPSARPQLAAALAGSSAPLKARLLDQSRVAGIGNLIADELLWRAALSPLRPSGSLTPTEIRRLHRHLGRTVGRPRPSGAGPTPAT